MKYDVPGFIVRPSLGPAETSGASARIAPAGSPAASSIWASGPAIQIVA